MPKEGKAYLPTALQPFFEHYEAPVYMQSLVTNSTKMELEYLQAQVKPYLPLVPENRTVVDTIGKWKNSRITYDKQADKIIVAK